jgi:SNF2 family DNA or RNA helicase
VRVLHSAWLSDAERLVVWAEDGSKARTAPPRRGRPPRQRRPAPHPFAIGHDGVRLAAAEVGGAEADDLIIKADEVELLLRLPGTATGPTASPLLEDEPARPDSPGSSNSAGSGETLLPEWTAPGLALRPGDAARLTIALCAADPWSAVVTGEPDVVLAADLRFTAKAADLALELITRGRILPDLELPTTGRRARWRPLVDRNDRGRIEALSWNLPASFTCAGMADEGHRPGSGSDQSVTPDALRSYMWSVTDALTRRFLADRPPAKPPPGRRRHPAGTDAVDAWLSALTSPDGAAGPGIPNDLDAPADQSRSLAEALRAWHATADTAAEAVRTCFRIQPPTFGEEKGDGDGDEGDDEDRSNRIGHEGDVDADAGPPRSQKRGRRPPAPARADDWRIEFALQAVDDPSLFVRAPAVWADGPELTALERHVAHPDELLLRGLGLAARLVPSLGSALATATPSEQVTDAAGVLRFLREGAPILEEAGFGVLAPPWWRSARTRLGLRLKARTRSDAGSSTAVVGLDGLCDVRWEVALGDDRLELAELRVLARLKQPLVRVRGQWVELRAGDIEAAIAAVGKKGIATQMGAGDVLRAALGFAPASDGDGALPVTEVQADGWLGDLLAGAEDRRLQSRPTPDGFAGQLRPYQERGLGWLAFLGDLGLGACLADDMGLGKTAQLLALLVDDRARSPRSTGPTLVFCPMSLVGNWQRETERFAPDLSVYVHHGPDRLDGRAFTRQAKKTDLVLSTYGLAARDQQLLATVPWRRLVLDEAQQIKNSAARTTQSVRAIPAERRIAMTGTPVENRLAELWSIMQFLNPGLLGSEKSFRERFAVPIERMGNEDAASHLRRVTAPFVLRRLKTDRTIIADLPDKIEMKEFCTLTREQATLYQAVVDDMLDRIDNSEGMERRGLVLATMMKLKQVCNHPAHFLADGSALPGRSGKLTRLVEVLDEAVQEGDRALVFTQFTEMGDMLERYLRRQLACEVLWLHGGVPKKKRDTMVECFQGAGGPPVFLLSLKAGGTGLNLTAATHVVHFDRWWNPAVENQATDRAFRIGQRSNVQVRKFICGGTLEERIDAMIEAKRALAERIVGSGEGWITEMSTEQLREVIALSADAVGED